MALCCSPGGGGIDHHDAHGQRDPVNVGDVVTLTAKVKGTGLGGTMTFEDGTNVITSGTVPSLTALTPSICRCLSPVRAPMH
jgi:hypothetical protein